MEHKGHRELERQLRALGNRRRLAILKFLKREGEAPVGDIADEINLSFKSTSRHLGVLTNAEILEKEQRSLKVFYRLASAHSSAVAHVITLL
jgi:DNA-binding transcriptional ArsR family regulator